MPKGQVIFQSTRFYTLYLNYMVYFKRLVLLKNARLYLQSLGCTYKGQVVPTKARLYLQMLGCTYKGQVIPTKAWLYLQRLGCTYKAQVISTKARFYLTSLCYTYKVQVIPTKAWLYLQCLGCNKKAFELISLKQLIQFGDLELFFSERRSCLNGSVQLSSVKTQRRKKGKQKQKIAHKLV